MAIVSRTLKYRLCPNRKQREALARTLDVCRGLYNIMLEQRRYHRTGKYEQMRQLTQLRAAFPEYQAVAQNVTEDVAKRVDQSFQNLFRGAGFPRFKGKGRYDSFTFRSGFKLAGSRVQLFRIGNVKLRLSRCIPSNSAIKTCIVRQDAGNWYACFSVELDQSQLPASSQAVGVDVGIDSFAALSDGSLIANPRIYETMQPALRRAQRRLARRNRGSNRRRKAAELLRKIHSKIRNRRMDFLHKQSTALVTKYGLIAVEGLNVKGLAGGILAKQVNDASWAEFFRQLSYKAAGAGREFVAVNPNHTSQTCPQCGTVKKKLLSERRHRRECGCDLNRDVAAAQVILARTWPSGANLAEPIRMGFSKFPDVMEPSSLLGIGSRSGSGRRTPTKRRSSHE